MIVAKTVGREIPRIFAKQLGHGAKNARLDHHPSVKLVVAVQPREPLNGKPKQNHAPLDRKNPPAIHPGRLAQLRGHRRNLERNAIEFVGPQIAQILGGRCNSAVENVNPTAE